MTQHDALVRMLSKLAAHGGGLAGAIQNLKELGIENDRIEAAVDQYQNEVATIRTLGKIDGLDDDDLPAPWYRGPEDDHVFWPQVRKALIEKQKLPEDAVSMIDQASTAVVSRIAPPGRSQFQVRGLVVGHVQSGKTTNFISVLAKAADVGYRLFILLSGLTNNLRLQTQRRVQDVLIGPREEAWFNLTSEGDFTSPGNAAHLLQNSDRRLVGVIKKNPARLRRLNRWLDSAPEEVLDNLPIMVVDDEADQASIDVSSEQERSTINSLILQLLNRRRVTYVGYTATPFANLLIDPSYPEGLYPRHFIIDLPKPEGYSGPETIFGREPLTHETHEEAPGGYNMVREIPERELQHIRPPYSKEKRAGWEPHVTPSLESAIRYFTMAASARRVRGTGPRHSTMLIHTTQLTDPQLQLREPVVGILESLARRLEGDEGGLRLELERQWRGELEAVDASEFDEDPVDFEQVMTHLPELTREISVVVDNYRSDERLDYDKDYGAVIVIGGNTLSRGLTLEGLVVSYFCRSTSYYDSLLQMGRWFGFRKGYADLPRVWMTSDLLEWFGHLATVEQEIRYEFERYEAESLTPLDVPVRIRTHPKLNVTSAAKMSDAVHAKMSFEGRRLQTILFKHRDPEWLQANIDATTELLRTAAETTPHRMRPGRWMTPAVHAALILRFIENYRFHEDSYDLNSDLISGYIRDQNEFEELEHWNVVVMGANPGGQRETIDLGFSDPVGLITRSKLKNTGQPHANIKALTSRADIVADLEEEPSDLSFRNLISMRPEGIGLLLLYPIDRHSPPGHSDDIREALNAVNDVIGVALVFPSATHSTPQNYISADLDLEREEQEPVSSEDLDPEMDEEAEDNP